MNNHKCSAYHFSLPLPLTLCFFIIINLPLLLLKVVVHHLQFLLTSPALSLCQAEEEMYRGMSSEEMEQLVHEIFDAVDTGGTGELDPQEFAAALTMSRLELTEDEVEQFMAQLDTDGNGKISFSE